MYNYSCPGSFHYETPAAQKWRNIAIMSDDWKLLIEYKEKNDLFLKSTTVNIGLVKIEL